MNISIALASYNGANYIEEQIISILEDINKEDEIVISDDGSTDGRVEKIREYMLKDSRIKLIFGPRNGIIKNFEHAILACNNSIIFLSDQDDIWVKGKREKVLKVFRDYPLCHLVTHNGMSVDKNLKSKGMRLKERMRHGVLKNILFSSYFGCCMAFKKEACREFLPFPDGVAAHDQWIGLIEEEKKKTIFLENEELILHREHGNNTTKRLPFLERITFRLNLLWNLIIYRGEK